MNILDEIKARFARSGWTQAKLAAEVGVRQATISDLLRGVKEPRVGLAQNILNALEDFETPRRG